MIRINGGAFCDCIGLTAVSIPDNVTTIECNVFRCCTGLTNIELPASIISVSEDSFIECDSLNEIIVPEGQKERFAKMKGLVDYVDKIIEKQ